MDKNTYETYEYIPINNDDNDASQFFVIQEDGTFLSINKPVQFVTQVQDAKQTLDGTQPCAVYDVNPQQFYVNVDDTSELIEPEQFVIPEGENNMYTNSYLLQAVENEKQEQMEQDNVSQNKEVTVSNESAKDEEYIKIENAESRNGDCTEITLNDEQYQLLEKNGWILLEISERIFLLDTLGLRDITDDEKLIEKLKHEIEADNSEETPASSVKEEKRTSYETSEIHNTDDTVNFVIEGEDVIQDNENSQDTSTYYENEEEVILVEESNENGHLTSAQSPHDYVRLNSVKGTSVKRENNALKIRTCFSFKDIPPQIVLGKTIHGKNLVASVRTEKSNNLSKNSKQTNSFKSGSGQCNTGLDEDKFKNLIQEAIWGTGEKCTMKDVTAAEIVVEQLLRVPTFRSTVLERRLIITKMVIQEYEQTGKMYAESIPTLVTGQVVRTGPKLSFLYMPDMLQLSAEDDKNDHMNQRNKDPDDDHYLHIHIRELKGIDGITRISITLNKRHISLKDVNYGNNVRQKLIYACSACAAVYKTEEGLKLHQETECMDIDDVLTIDAENTDIEYTIVGVGNERQYVCNQCNALFTKLSNCQKHLSTHYKQDEEMDDSEMASNQSSNEGTKKGFGNFKCKMCPSTYFYASTLSKHIVSKHIKIKP